MKELYWRSIGTAPKDGTGVLLCWAINAGGNPIDWEKDPSTADVFVQAASWWGGENDGKGAWMVYNNRIHEEPLHFEPTHWMPLPPPPQKQINIEEENNSLRAVIRELRDELQDNEDTVDGPEGPKPNFAMKIGMYLNTLCERYEIEL